jgi:hypothetical protein
MAMDSALLIAELKSATNGLLFSSEAEYPVKIFLMEGKGRKSLKSQDILDEIKNKSKTPIKQISFDELFEIATEEQSWHNASEQEKVKKFQYLVKLLKDNLIDIKVFRVGKVEFTVYVVGKIESGDFVGVTTKLVET